jgi:hypothetical protein
MPAPSPDAIAATAHFIPKEAKLLLKQASVGHQSSAVQPVTDTIVSMVFDSERKGNQLKRTVGRFLRNTFSSLPERGPVSIAVLLG